MHHSHNEMLTINTGNVMPPYLFKKVLTAKECDRIIEISIRDGNDDNTIGTNKSVLTNQKRMKYANYSLTQKIYSKIKAVFEKKIGQQYIASDTMITYVHYNDGASCPLHYDSKVDNGIGKEEYITVIVYLNDIVGGRTYFKPHGKTKLFISPERGDILVFNGRKIEHGCEKVIGEKQIIIFGIEK
jgi:hypothetical protein